MKGNLSEAKRKYLVTVKNLFDLLWQTFDSVTYSYIQGMKRPILIRLLLA